MKTTVLLVDDEPAIRMLISSVLEQQGYEVLNAEDGETGLALFRENVERVELIVTDLLMPKMGGVAMTARLDQDAPDVPILFISGFDGTGEGIAGQIDGRRRTLLLKKPFRVADLVTSVKELLEVA